LTDCKKIVDFKSLNWEPCLIEIQVCKPKLWCKKIILSTPSRKVFKFKTPQTTHLEYPVGLHTFLSKCLHWRPPPNQNFQWTFHGMGVDIVWNCTFNNIADRTSSLKGSLELASEEQIWLDMVCYPWKQTDNWYWNFALQKCLVIRVVKSRWQLTKITVYLMILACYSTGLFMFLQKRWQCNQSPTPSVLQPTSKLFDNPELCRKQDPVRLNSVRVRLHLGLLCSTRKYPYSPHRRDWNFQGEWGVL